MSTFLKKVFSFNDMKHSWLLLISMVWFIASFYIERNYDPTDQYIGWMGYGGGVLLAMVWSIFNYISHIRVNKMYQKHHSISAYVNQLTINKEERNELQAYLEDYANDLLNQGKTEKEANEAAIRAFQVQEFSSLSKNTSIFNLHAHYYLIGYTTIAVIVVLILNILTNTIYSTFTLIVIEYVCFAYGIGFALLFFLYKMFDVLLYRTLKIQNQQ